MKKVLLLSHLLLIFSISISGLAVHAEDSDDSEESVSEPAMEKLVESPSPDFEDVLANMTQEQPTDSLGINLVRSAGAFGATADRTVFSKSELDLGPAIGMDFDKLTDMRHDSGFMKQGMAQHFGARIVANINISNLFQQFAALRSQPGISLPSSFANLVSFVEQYIRANDTDDAEKTNGINHRSLAVQVVRASFCFGNDPFMIIAKMRRETNFSRRLVSPTGAVGWSQMTGIAIKEVQAQLSGDPKISLPEAKSAFQMAIRCFTGINQYQLPSSESDVLKSRVASHWALDMVFGQILVKTLVSYAKAGQSYGANSGGVVAAYEDAFTAYNGDSQSTAGICLKKKSVAMKDEYACDVISQFNRMNAQWNRFILHSTGKDII